MSRKRDAVLLVGGTGFIGRALARRLSKEGWQVHVLSRHGWAGDPPPAGVVVHRGDQGNESILVPLLEACSHIFHLAAATTPADTAWQPAREAEECLLPALRFLECTQRFPDNRYFLVSTGGALYGDAELATEDTLLRPASYHGAGKVAIEQFFGVLGRRYPGRLTILRPANVYGPGQPLREGFGLARNLLDSALYGKRVTIYGDGSIIRDYLYLDDMVMGCLRALVGPAGIYNLGAGEGTPLAELLSVVERVTGRRLNVRYEPARVSDARRIVLNIRLAKERLDWSPSVRLEEGVARTWESIL
jgi:UDP-glucose 4-epimerase